MPEPVLDAVALRVLAFAHRQGIAIMLSALDVPRALIPAEVYDRDEEQLPLFAPDEDLSEVARGMRFARRRAETEPNAPAARYRAWLVNARQLPDHFERGALVIERLDLEDFRRRAELEQRYGIGRGEAACFVLALRHRSNVVFLSSDEQACRVAAALGLTYLTLVDVLKQWVARDHPPRPLVDEMIAGMCAAKFGLSERVVQGLRLLVDAPSMKPDQPT